MQHGNGPYVEIDLAAATKIANAKGAKSDTDRAKVFGLHPSTWSRFKRGSRTATQDVIAKVLTTCQELKFYDLFRVKSG